jgi:hypothetical protein
MRLLTKADLAELVRQGCGNPECKDHADHSELYLHGIEPSPTNRAKIEKFLDSQSSPTGVVGAGQPEKIGVPPASELFGRPQPQPEPEPQ